jgi:ABC-type amino acid transport substrate-binding protein
MRLFLLPVLLAFCSSLGLAQSFDVPDSLLNLEADKMLVVGIKESPPFIMDQNGEWNGLSIYLWEEIAKNLKVSYEHRSYEELGELLEAVKKGEVDISVNPLTVTPDRLLKVDFTQPFFITNLAIAVKKDTKGPVLRILSNIFSWRFFMAVLVLGAIILTFGLLTWLFERKHRSMEFENSPRGLWDAFWWSAVTMTTVGYGDKAPKSTGGRVVALIWMFTAIVIISGFTATIASSLTLDQLSLDIKSVQDLKELRVVTLSNSTSEYYLNIKGVNSRKVTDINEALDLLVNKEADAVVYDEPIMRYAMDEKGYREDITIVPGSMYTQYYAFATQRNNIDLKAFNLALLKEIDSMDWKAELGQYQLD